MKFETNYKIEDYTGTPIFHLTPIAVSPSRAKDGSVQWDFRCVCGNVITLTPYRVISGHNKSCGCMRYKNIHHKDHVVQKPKIEENEYIGKTAHKLKVIDVIKEPGQRAKLKCVCECGKETYVYPYQWGEIKSCGCVKGKHRISTDWENRTGKGLSSNPLYKTWYGMVRRCTNPSYSKYKNYGGRGITVCEEWLNSPQAFYDWVESIGGKPENTTLDRIDNDKGYSPDNCRWASTAVQNRNRRTTRNITYKGKTQCLADWCSELGIYDVEVYKKVKGGLSFEEAIDYVLSLKSKT